MYLLIPTGGSHRKVGSFVHVKKCPAESAEEITRRIAEMVARDLWSININEGVGFMHLLSYMKPGYHVPPHALHSSKPDNCQQMDAYELI